MQAGNTYTVTVTIDPKHVATYSVVVPGVTPVAAVATANGTADVNAQSGNFFTMIGNWLSSLFGGK
jgi:hypothetical protein